MTIPKPPTWLMLAAFTAVLIALLHNHAARGENCLTTTNTGTTTVPAQTFGSFFLVSVIEHVASDTPAAFTNATALTPGTNKAGTAPTGLSCGTAAVASGKQSVAIGQNAVASAPNSVALGNGAVATRANSVSVGSPAMPNQITNVAAGTAPTDAVNVSQLNNSAAAAVAPLQQQISNQQTQINNVQQQVTTLKKQTFAGISMAMAAAALQTGAGSAGAGKVAIGMGGGEFGGTASLSAGIAYSPTKRLNFNAGVSVAPVVGMFGIFGGTTYTLN